MYNVYLADDERLVIHGLEQRVNWERMKCRVIGSAQDGVTALRQIMELKPDIVITDILMPGMTGLELIRRAEQELECAFIIFSGYSKFEYAKQALRLGTVDYLIKPADIEEIEESIMKAQEWLEQNKLIRSSAMATDEYEQMQMVRLLSGIECEASNLKGLGIFLPITIAVRDCEEELHEAVAKMGNPICRIFSMKDKSNIVLVAAAREEKDVVYFRKRFAVQMAKLRHNHREWYWGMGYLCDDAGELSASYAQANEMLEYCRFIGEQIGDEYERLHAYEPAAFQEQVRSIAALAMQEDDAHHVYHEVRNLLNDAVQHKLSINAMEDLTRDLLYEMRTIVEKIFGEFADKNIYQLFATAELKNVRSKDRLERRLIETIQNVRNYTMSSATQDQRSQVERIKIYIGQNFTLPLTLTDIAENIKLNPSYVSHIFKKETGENLFDYIARLRIERAQELLRATDWKIAKISREVGIEDQRYFCQVFKKRVGSTATAYRWGIIKDNLKK